MRNVFLSLLVAALPLFALAATPGPGVKADANTVNAGPSSGSPALPTYRTLASGDVAQAVAVKFPVRAATTTSGTLSTSFENGDTVDGVTLATGDRLLIKDQGTASENGIYIVAATGTPARATDADVSAELPQGLTVAVKAGTANGGKVYLMTANADPVVVGTSNLTFTTVSGSGAPADGDKGDITVSSTGTVWTIDNNAVSFAKIQNVATDRLAGRDTTGSGSLEEISVGGGIEFTGSAGIQRSALTGDVTASAGSNSTTIANNAVTTVKIADSNVTSAKIASAAVGYSQLTAANQLTLWGNRNRIRNGAMLVHQRNYNASGASATSGTYMADGFSTDLSYSGTPTYTHDTDVPAFSDAGVKFRRSIKFIGTQDASLSNEYVAIRARVEADDIMDIVGDGYNTGFTLSFWAKASVTGTYCVSFWAKSPYNRTYTSEYTVSNTNWNRHSVTVTASPTAGGTWGTGNDTGLNVFWTLAAQGTLAGATNNTWHTTNYLATSSQTNVFLSGTANFWLTGVQLEAGTSATLFEWEPISRSIARCQRYYEKSYNLDVAPGTVTNDGIIYGFGRAASATQIDPGPMIFFRTPKRSTSYTITGYNAAFGTSGQWRWNGSYNDTVQFFGQGLNSCGTYSATGGSTLSTNSAYFAVGHWVVENELP